MADKVESFSEVETKQDEDLQNLDCGQKNPIEDAASSKQNEHIEPMNDTDVDIESDCVIKSPGGLEGEETKVESQSNPVDDSHENSNSLNKSKCIEDNEISDSQRKESDSESENHRHSADEEERVEELDVSVLGASGCVNNNNNEMLDCPVTDGKTESVKEKKKKNRPGIQRLYGGSGDNPSKKDKKIHKKHQNKVLENEEELKTSKNQFHFFWQSKSVLSQWYRSTFYVDNFEYNCAEQYMMHQKALMMGDEESAGIIMALSDPREQKSVGRSVKNFNQEKWDDNCISIVKKGNIAKFSQDDYLKKFLFSTYPKLLVEASPIDKIWGIGLTEDDKRAWSKKTWRGENRLGQILTEVRDELMRDANFLDS